jgi:hypothetical protein
MADLEAGGCGCAAVQVAASRHRPSRRTLLRGLLGSALTACAAPAVRTPTEQVAEFPLIDVHSHYASRSMADFGVGPDQLLRAMDEAGIRRMVVLGFGPEVPVLARTHGDRFVAAYVYRNFRTRQAGGEITDGRAPNEVERIGAEFEQALDSGLYRGLGEITTIARPLSSRVTGGQAGPGANVSPDSPLVRRLIALAGRHGVPINIHCDALAAAPMARAVRAHPGTTVIWAHGGSYLSPSACAGFLRDHPNLYFDLSSKNVAFSVPGSRVDRYPLDGLRGIDEGWRQLFEAYPDRILFAVDFLAARHLAMAREIGDYYRGLLAQLTPAVARKIGYENARRLHGL